MDREEQQRSVGARGDRGEPEGCSQRRLRSARRALLQVVAADRSIALPPASQRPPRQRSATLTSALQRQHQRRHPLTAQRSRGPEVAGQPLRVKVNGATPTEIDTWASIAAVQSPADGSQAKLITPLGSFSPSEAIKLT